MKIIDEVNYQNHGIEEINSLNDRIKTTNDTKNMQIRPMLLSTISIACDFAYPCHEASRNIIGAVTSSPEKPVFHFFILIFKTGGQVTHDGLRGMIKKNRNSCSGFFSSFKLLILRFKIVYITLQVQ
ncbi:hypothetical protein [Catalinimonas niigatensis]|uniref:hypothetical protein n=1 Tax=Catalinimonas niigatensis TaxID=1397264 RepID=UPI002666139A|nr:hypothetical protein [Catalinimonas niigatensis]WPP50980.1 hypothetical protein PZB72_01050 [Catalinimonas niigatensis]